MTKKVEAEIRKETVADGKDYTPDQKEAIDSLLRHHNYYKILGLSNDATGEDLRRQYKKLALQFHPDKNRAPRADEAFKAISNAYQILSNPSKRQSYDMFGEDGLRTREEWTTGFQGDIPPEELFQKFFEEYGSRRQTVIPKEDLEESNKLFSAICKGVLYFFIIFYALSAVLYFTNPWPSSRRANKKYTVFHSQQYSDSVMSRNDLPVLQEPLVGRGNDMSVLVKSLDFAWPHYVVSVYGKTAVGKSSLAIYLGYELASHGIDVLYLDLSEIQLLNAPRDVTKGHMSVDELVDWARNLHTETVLILDNCNLLKSLLSDLLLQLYTATNFVNLKVIVTTSQVLTQSDVPSQVSHKAFSHFLRDLDTDSAVSILQNLTTVKLSEKECRALTQLAGNYPHALRIIASLLNHDITGGVASVVGRLKWRTMAVRSVPRNFLSPLWMSHDQMGIIGQGCARYLSLFPGSFDKDAALQVLSSSGFSDPDYCIQILADYSLIEQYTHYQQQRFKIPRVVRNFYIHIRYEHQHHDYETTTFQRGFKEHYTQLFGPLTNKNDESNLLRVESHNIRYLNNIP